MKIVIPSYGRAQTLKTHLWLEKGGITDYRILLHSEACHEAYRKNPTIRPETLLVTGAAPGISNQRRWIIENHIAKNEWFLTLDDNIRSMHCVHPAYYEAGELPTKSPGFDKRIFQHEPDAGHFMGLFARDIAWCERNGIGYAGFATVPNFYFLSKKYRYVGYVISKAALIKNVGIEYDPNILAMDDYAFTAEHLLRHGRVLINNFIIPQAGHYEEGGIGTYEQRLPKKIQDCKYLMAKYPGLFRFKEKSGAHPEAELQVRFTSLKQVDAWRRDLMLGEKA